LCLIFALIAVIACNFVDFLTADYKFPKRPSLLPTVKEMKKKMNKKGRKNFSDQMSADQASKTFFDETESQFRKQIGACFFKLMNLFCFLLKVCYYYYY